MPLTYQYEVARGERRVAPQQANRHKDFALSASAPSNGLWKAHSTASLRTSRNPARIELYVTSSPRKVPPTSVSPLPPLPFGIIPLSGYRTERSVTDDFGFALHPVRYQGFVRWDNLFGPTFAIEVQTTVAAQCSSAVLFVLQSPEAAVVAGGMFVLVT